MDELRLAVTSWSDRDDLVIELTVGDGEDEEDWGLVTHDERSGRAVINLYPRATGNEWQFDLDELRHLLDRAKKRILDVAGPIPVGVD